jgi:branched-chain amino acid transport system substrate-binding protein
MKQKISWQRWLGAAVATSLLATACGSDAGGEAASDEPETVAEEAAPEEDETEGEDAGEEAASACTEPIKIGMLNPTSGVYASIAEEIERGFELYVSENGGELGGRAVDLIVEDTEANPEVAVRAANKLINQDQVEFATGVISSAVALAVADAFSEAEIPVVISNAVGTVLTGPDRSDYIFRVSLSGWQGSYPGAQWIRDNWTEEAVFTSAPDYAAGRDFASSFEAGIEDAGGAIAGAQFPPFAQTQDYQPYLSEIRNSGAEAVYAFYAGAEAVNFVNQYAQFGLAGEVPLLGAISLVSDDVLPAQGDAAEGIHILSPWSVALDNETNQNFLSAYEAAHGESRMGYAAPFAYDAAQLIDVALQATNGCTDDPQALISAMEGAELDSPRGPLTIDPETHGTVQTMYVMEVQEQDGELVHVPVADLGVWGEQPGSGPQGD